MAGGRFGDKRLFLSPSSLWLEQPQCFALQSLVQMLFLWSLYFLSLTQPDPWRVWKLLLCKLVPEACDGSHDITGVVTAGAPSAQRLSRAAFLGCENWNVHFWTQVPGGGWGWGWEGWGLRGQSSSHCSLPGVMLDRGGGETGLCKTHLKFHNLLPR